MSHIKTVSVRTDPAYQVSIGPGLLGTCGQLLRPLLPPCRAAVVADTTVAEHYLHPVTESLQAAGFSVTHHLFPAGEEHKNLTTLGELLSSLAAVPLTRKDCIVALGGGVTGDMAGFAAAVYLRGIRFVQIPTTLLAAVDSSVGGKTAVDLPSGKNLVGAFLQPAAVILDTDTLSSLPPETFADGAAEAIKTGVLSGEALFQDLAQGGLQRDLTDIILRCVAYKAGVVERDEKERGERRLLNLGHTPGHAIEACSRYAIPHGHAVAMGLGIMARAADRLGWTREPMAARIEACLRFNHLPTGTTFSPGELARAALSDKKRSGDTITLVIPEAMGQCTQKSIPVTKLEAVFAAGMEE